MGLSRRQFTKEFKLAAVRRLEQGVSIAPQLFFDPVRSSVMDLARELDDLVADPTRQERAPLNGCA